MLNKAILVAVTVVAIAVTAGILVSFGGDDRFITVDVPKNMVAGERYSATITLPEEFFEKYRTVKLHFTNNEYRNNFAAIPEGVNKGSVKIVPQEEGPFSVKAVYGKMSDKAVSDVAAALPKPVPNIQVWVPDRIHIWKNYHGTITMKEPSTTDRTVLLSGSGGINLHQTHVIIPAGIESQTFRFTVIDTAMGTITATHGNDVTTITSLLVYGRAP